MAALAEALVEVLLPSPCDICGRGLPWRGSRAGVCESCWGAVAAHAEPVCPSCGEPAPGGEICLACREAPPPWPALATYGPYRDTLRELILAFKYRRRDELATPLAELLQVAFDRAGWERPALVVPVPLPWARQLRRGFNQAQLLAEPLARALDVRCRSALRRRSRVAQVGRSRSARLHLPMGAVQSRTPVAGAALLVDDVVTTGATARSCVAALRRAGAEEVFVLALARTFSPGRAQ